MTQDALPLDAFSFVDRPHQYLVPVRIEATVMVEVAPGVADPREIAETCVRERLDDEFHVLLGIDSAEIAARTPQPLPRMYRVTRDGRALQTSLIQPGDQPREPDERGF